MTQSPSATLLRSSLSLDGYTSLIWSDRVKNQIQSQSNSYSDRSLVSDVGGPSNLPAPLIDLVHYRVLKFGFSSRVIAP